MLRTCALFLSLGFGLAQLDLARMAFARQATPAIGDAGAAPAALPPATAIRLDVSVTDKAGNPVAGLQPGDFSLLDNGHAATIGAFHAHASDVLPDDQSPVHVILVIDSMDDNFNDVAYERIQVQKFLRRNGGHLDYPVSVDWVTEKGIKAQNDPTLDGNALADALTGVESRLRSTIPSQGVEGAIDRFRIATQILGVLARTEGAKPGKKLVIWIGAGWPLLGGPQYMLSKRDDQQVFSGIIEMSRELREARISLFTVSQGQANHDTFFYNEFLKGVRHPEDASLADLSPKVLATETGGLVEMPTNDLAGSIADCIRGAGTFYTLTFNPPPAGSADEYHKLELRIANRRGLTVRTTAGYYSQPPDRAQNRAQDQPH